MNLLVDCTPLSTGGGVQVAIAFLDGLGGRPDIDWVAVVPEGLREAVAPIADRNPRRFVFVAKGSRLDMLRARHVLQREERRLGPDVVYSVFGPAYFKARAPHLVGFALPNLIYELTGPLAATDTTATRIGDAVRCQLFRQADHLLVETETVRGRLARRIGCDIGRITVIGNSVNPILKRHPARPVEPGGRFAMLVPSAYYLHKNLEILPQVAAALRAAAPALDFEIRLTLPATDPAWQAIAADAAARGVGDRVVTLGQLSLDQLAVAYCETSVTLLPTLREASTAVYPESFHFQRPLVTSDLDFARELCGDAALYAPPLDPEAFAAAVWSLAREPHLAAAQIANGTRRLASQYPSPEHKFEQMITLLRRLATPARRSSAPANRAATSR